MKRIYGILPTLASGGAERQLLVLLGQLAERGYDTYLVTYVGARDAYEVSQNVKRLQIHGGNGIRDRWNLAQFMWRVVKPDDIVIAFLSINYRDIVLPVLPLRRKILAGERNLTTSENVTRKLVFQLERKAKAIVANSHAQKHWMSKYKPWLAHKTFTIINFTDTDIFRPIPELLNNEDRVVIGVLARFSPQKNCIRFAQAVSKVMNSGYTNFRIVWHGDMHDMRGGLNEEYCRFKAFIEENGLDGYIEVKDKTSEVLQVNNYCDVMCLPSLFEGFSNSLSESICCGKPVLASNVSDNPVIVKEGYNGFLFDPYDVDSMAVAMTKMINLSQDELRQMGDNSRNHALQLFNLKRFTDDYVKIIEGM